MDSILGWIEQLSPFLQGVLGSAVFAFTTFIAQKVIKKSKSSGAKFLDAYKTLDVHKHLLHKHFVRSGEPQMVTFGVSVALLQSARWLVLALMIMIFVFGVQSAVDGRWFYVAGAWFSFNSMFEAWNWVKDSSNVKSVEHVSQEKIDEVTTALLPEEFREQIKEQSKKG